MLSRLQNANTIFSHLTQTLSLVWAASRHWTLAWMVLLIVQGLLPTGSVYLTRILVNGLVAVVGSGTSWASIQPILIPVVLMAAVLLLSEVLQGASDWVRTAQSELVQDYISSLIHQKSEAIDYGCYES
ncbi:MAG TPA: hypothetical protein V6C57_26710, partial [Coleofasciculaceae cyanobacterium]